MIPLLTDLGKEMLNYQDDLAKQYKYKNQPPEVADFNYEKYYNNLPECFKKGISHVDIGYSVKSNDIPLYSREGLLISNKYNRIVLGQYGAFIEIDDADIMKKYIKVKPGQEYRINDGRYSGSVKYQWFTTRDCTNCKLYFQQKGVTYADYQAGKWYISPYEVLTKEEIYKHMALAEYARLSYCLDLSQEKYLDLLSKPIITDAIQQQLIPLEQSIKAMLLDLEELAEKKDSEDLEIAPEY